MPDRVSDERVIPFSMIHHETLEQIYEHFEGSAVSSAISIYVAIAYKCSKDRARGGDGSVELTRKELAAKAGVSMPTITRYAPLLEEASLIRVQRQKLKGRNSHGPSLYTLLDPSAYKGQTSDHHDQTSPPTSDHHDQRVESSRSEGLITMSRGSDHGDQVKVEKNKEGRREEEDQARGRALLGKVASRKLSPLPSPAELGSIHDAFPGLDIDAEAERFAGYYLDGDGAQTEIRSFKGAWRSWLSMSKGINGRSPKPKRPRSLDVHNRARNSRAEQEAWVRSHLPDLDDELVDRACSVLSVLRLAGRGREVEPDQVRARLAAAGHMERVA